MKEDKLKRKVNFYYKLIYGSVNPILDMFSTIFEYKMPIFRNLCMKRISSLNYKIGKLYK